MGKLLRLAKQKGVDSYEYTDSFKRISDDELPDRFEFFSSLKDECISEKRLFACYWYLGYVWNENNRWFSWSLLKNKRFILSLCFWNVYSHLFRILWIRSFSLF